MTTLCKCGHHEEDHAGVKGCDIVLNHYNNKPIFCNCRKFQPQDDVCENCGKDIDFKREKETDSLFCSIECCKKWEEKHQIESRESILETPNKKQNPDDNQDEDNEMWLNAVPDNPKSLSNKSRLGTVTHTNGRQWHWINREDLKQTLKNVVETQFCFNCGKTFMIEPCEESIIGNHYWVIKVIDLKQEMGDDLIK